VNDYTLTAILRMAREVEAVGGDSSVHRLVAADRVEEIGFEAWAAFIRASVEWERCRHLPGGMKHKMMRVMLSTFCKVPMDLPVPPAIYRSGIRIVGNQSQVWKKYTDGNRFLVRNCMRRDAERKAVPAHIGRHQAEFEFRGGFPATARVHSSLWLGPRETKDGLADDTIYGSLVVRHFPLLTDVRFEHMRPTEHYFGPDQFFGWLIDDDQSSLVTDGGGFGSRVPYCLTYHMAFDPTRVCPSRASHHYAWWPTEEGATAALSRAAIAYAEQEADK
jgi:hypothetical protein